MKLVSGRARTLGEPVLAAVKVETRRFGRKPGAHGWTPFRYLLEVGEIASCACGLRIKRVPSKGFRYEALDGGKYPSVCPMPEAR